MGARLQGRLRRQIIGTAVLIVAVFATRGLFHPVGWLWRSYDAVFIGWVWLPLRYRNWRPTLILIFVCMAALIAASTEFSVTPIVPWIAMICAVFLASCAPPLFWGALSLVGLAVTELLFVPLGPHQNVVADLMTLGGVYFGVLGARVRRESRRLDQARLVELEGAYRALSEAHQQLKETTAQVAESRAQEERLRIAADIHDGVGHRLTSLIIGLESIDVMLPDDVQTAKSHVPDLVTTARQALNDVREAVHASHTESGTFSRDTFDALVERAAHGAGWQAHIRWMAEPDNWPTSVRIALFRVVQEALTNILRHTRAHHVRLDFEDRPDAVTVRIQDDGELTSPLTPGFGLAQMRHRCQVLGGALTWDPHPPHGLTLQAVIPLEVKKP